LGPTIPAPVEETFAEVWVDSEAVGSTSSSLDIA
jgi:hypothetical protein